jgi:hypothetical protein
MRETEAAASALGVTLQPLAVRDPGFCTRILLQLLTAGYGT